MYNQPIATSADEIDNLITVVRARINFGQTKFEIGRDLGRKYSQDKIYLAYVAATMLIEAS